jgi:hypothetical protein
MKSNSKNEMTYDYICFGDLAYEFNADEAKETEKKIKRRLRYYSSGGYDQNRVDYIRVLRNDLYHEITKCKKSQYYLGPTGKFAHPKDFEFEKLKKDYLEKYPEVTDHDMGRMINFAIYLFYLR